MLYWAASIEYVEYPRNMGFRRHDNQVCVIIAIVSVGLKNAGYSMDQYILISFEFEKNFNTKSLIQNLIVDKDRHFHNNHPIFIIDLVYYFHSAITNHI